MKVRGQLVDVFSSSIYPAEVTIKGKRIESVRRLASAPRRYILPGLVDAHDHIESSMLIPSSFSHLEIANVMGMPGVLFMIRNARKTPMKCYFGASPCVPATPFETSGAALGPHEIDRLLSLQDITHLSEVMNYPGVISRDPDMMEKIANAKRHGKRVDGHAPGLSGPDLDKYISAGIETDHECYKLVEAREKIRKGMKVIVREGSAAKNLEALHPALGDMTMLCSDDLDPRDLAKGHMDAILRKCVSLGVDPVLAVRNATRNAVEHYGLDVGLLREGDPADFVIARDLRTFRIQETWIDGKRVYGDGKVSFDVVKEKPINNFKARRKRPSDFAAGPEAWKRIIRAVDGELVTESIEGGNGTLPDKAHGISKITVVNRYRGAKPAVAFIKGFDIERGAFGSSVMHDSHNIGAVGADDDAICEVVNTIIDMKGGLAVHNGKKVHSLPLPFAGLMSDEPGEKVGKRYAKLAEIAKRTGCRMKSPFMTLSFMALLVIPHLKLSDRGLFDGDRFEFVK
jgi:adenine deaminase